MARGKPLGPLKPPPDASRLQVQIAIRLRDEMARQGIEVPALEARSGVSANAIYNAIHARQQPVLTSIEGIAAGLGKSLAWLIGDVPDLAPKQATTIPIRGGVHKDAWKSMALLDEPRGAAADVEPQDMRYRHLPRYGKEIEDDQLAGLAVPRGSVAIYADLAGSDLAIESRIYLVYRVDGDQVSAAFWAVAAFRDRYELRSVGNAAAPAAFTFSRQELEAGEAVRVAGILVATHTRSVTAEGFEETRTVRYL